MVLKYLSPFIKAVYFNLRQQQEEYFSVPAGLLRPWHAQLPGLEDESSWRGAAVWRGRAVAALNAHNVKDRPSDNYTSFPVVLQNQPECTGVVTEE